MVSGIFFFFSLSNLNLFIKEQKLFFHSGFGRVTLLENIISASQLWAALAGAVCGLHKSIPYPWRKWELLGSGSSVHWYLHAPIWVSQAWHWDRDIVQSPFVAVGLCYASRNAVTGKQSGVLYCKILANVNKLSLGMFLLVNQGQ